MTETPTKDKNITKVITDAKGHTQTVIFDDGSRLDFGDFLDLFKSKLRTFFAGEVITWDDEWRYQKIVEAKQTEEYLKIVEAEGIIQGSKMNLNRQQKMSLGVMIIIIFVIVVALMMLMSGGVFK